MARMLLIYSLIGTIFIEALNCSFYFAGARIRISQLVEILALLYLLVGWLLSKYKIRKTALDVPVWCYATINIIAVINAKWMDRSIKIALLVISLIVLYYIIVNLVNSVNVFDKAINFLLLAGILEISYGLYQVAAGMLNSFVGVELPVGHLGMVHGNYIGSSWGRPYGTFVEPDWYGTICMYFLLLFMPLYYDLLPGKKQKIYLTGMVVALIGLFFSFVRAAWLGFAVGTGILIIYNIKNRVLKINFVAILRKICITMLLLMIIVLTVAPIRDVLKERLNPDNNTNAELTFRNIRFKMMGISLDAMADHPIIGNGPGSAGYSYLVHDHGQLQAEGMIKKPKTSKGMEGFDPSIITTALSDTGLIGIILLAWLLLEFARQNIMMIGKLEGRYKSMALGLFAGFAGLITSYIFTQGMWLPFTWVFFALNIVSLKMGARNKIKDAA